MTKRAALCIILICIGFQFFTSGLYAQTLHHQMLSAQGTSKTTGSGLRVRHIIGQQSVSGNFSGRYIIQQGYQQSFWESYFPELNTIEVKTFPNPFTETVNFKFQDLNAKKILIEVFDILGRSIYSNIHTVEGNQIAVNLPQLESNIYLVILTDENLFYSTKIIKE